MKKLYLFLTLMLAMACIGVVRALIVADISMYAVPLSDLTDGMTVTLRVDYYNNNSANEYSAANAVLYDPKATDANGVGCYKMGDIQNEDLLESHVWVLEAASAPSGVYVEGAGKWFYMKNVGTGNYLTYKSIARSELELDDCQGLPAYITDNAAEAKPWLFAALETGVVELLGANPENDQWSNLYNDVKDDHVMVFAPIILTGESDIFWMAINCAVHNTETYGLATYPDWGAYIRIDEVTFEDNPYNELALLLDNLSVTEYPIGDTPGCVKPEYAERAAYYNQFIRDLGDYLDDPSTPSSKFGELLTEFKALMDEAASFEYLPVVAGYYRIVSAYPEYMSRQDAEKAMYISGDNLMWKNLDMESPDFIWQVSANAEGDELYLSALVNKDKYVQKSSTSVLVKVSESPSPVVFEVLGASGQFRISPNSGPALHTAGHSGGSGVSGSIVGWNGGASTASSWYVRPLTDEEVAEMEATAKQIALDAKMAELLANAKKLMSEAIAYDIISLDTLSLPTAIVQSEEQLSSPATEPSEGALANLLDGNPATFWHSQWNSPIPAAELHYLQIDLLEARQNVLMAYQCRGGGSMNDRPVTFEVTMDNDKDGEFAASMTLSGIDGNDTGMQYFLLCLPAEYRYIRLRATDCWNSSTKKSMFRTYWHAGELNFYEVGGYIKYTQMMNGSEDEYKDLAAAVEAAEAVVKVTQSDIDALEAATAAFRAVYWGPLDLQAAIDEANELLGSSAYGEGPGQKPESARDALQAVIDEAQAYLAEGAYTSANIKALIDKLHDAMDAWQTVEWNKFPADKWFYISKAKSNYSASTSMTKTYCTPWLQTILANTTGFDDVVWDEWDGAGWENQNARIGIMNSSAAEDAETFGGTGTSRVRAIYPAMFDPENEAYDALKAAGYSYSPEYCQWRFIPQEDGTYLIQNRGTGNFICPTYEAGNHHNGGVVEVASPMPGKFVCLSSANGCQFKTLFNEKEYTYLNMAPNGNVNFWTAATDKNSYFNIEIADDVDPSETIYVRIGYTGVAAKGLTLPYDINLDDSFGDDVIFDGIEGVDEESGTVGLKLASGEVKAGTPFIVFSSADDSSNGNIAVAAGDKFDFSADHSLENYSCLRGTMVANTEKMKIGEGRLGVNSRNTNIFGMAWGNISEIQYDEVALPGTAWVNIYELTDKQRNWKDSGESDFVLILDGNLAVAVDMVKAENGESKVIYNLNGQRVSANVKGIVIMNGKKVILTK